MPQEERRDSNLQNNPFSIRDLQIKYPYIEWLKYIKGILPEEVRIDDDEIINISEPSFFEQLGTIIENTPKR